MFDVRSFQPSPSPAVVEFDGGELVIWDEGKPRPRNSKAMAKEQAQELFHALAATPYRGEWDADLQCWVMPSPEYQGVTKQQAVTQKLYDKALHGDMTAIKEINDRLMGKPKQAMESVSMNMSYTEMLEMMAQQEAQQEEMAPTVDVSATNVYDSLELWDLVNDV